MDPRIFCTFAAADPSRTALLNGSTGNSMSIRIRIIDLQMSACGHHPYGPPRASVLQVSDGNQRVRFGVFMRARTGVGYSRGLPKVNSSFGPVVIKCAMLVFNRHGSAERLRRTASSHPG